MPPASLPGRGGGALRGPHGEWEPRPDPCSPGGHNRPAPRCGRRSPRAAAANDGDDRANRPRPSQPRRAEPRSHPRGEENARSPSLRVKLQHGFRLGRSSPSPYSGSSTLLPFSRRPPDCAAAIPEGALPAPRAPGPCALRPRAPARLRALRLRAPARRCGRPSFALSVAAAGPGAGVCRAAGVRCQKRVACPRDRGQDRRRVAPTHV